ncbi:MAG: type II toxin-antitoxin system RelE/ParE family toxin [Candidatus Sumerlaeota bacterium]|nr:type II toxin-antitoxin system RelE/ParE family toxin [Candidatus Sumerlaeota bacterium]
MIPVVFHAAARAELLAAAEYYESQQLGLGARFLGAVEDATERVQSNPVLYRIAEADVRQCRVLRFPYGVIYRVKAQHIEIVAVMHLRRKPGYWSSRLGNIA